MTIIEYIISEGVVGRKDAEAVMRMCCPFNFFDRDKFRSENRFCLTKFGTGTIELDCPVCWNQMYRKEFGTIRQRGFTNDID